MPPVARFEEAKAVFFDIDNTLYDFRASVRATLAHMTRVFPDVLGRFTVEDVERRYWAANAAMTDEAKLALIQRDPFLYRRATWLVFLDREARGLAPEEPLAVPLTTQYVADLASSGPHGEGDDASSRLAREFGKWRFDNLAALAYPGASETVREAKRSGRGVGIISNGPSSLQRAKFRSLGYEGVVPEPNVLISGEFGAHKPHPSIFLEAAKRANVRPEHAVYIGDSVECDVASKAVGMSFIFFDAERGPRPDFKAASGYEPDAVAHDYSEVRRLLGF